MILGVIDLHPFGYVVAPMLLLLSKRLCSGLFEKPKVDVPGACDNFVVNQNKKRNYPYELIAIDGHPVPALKPCRLIKKHLTKMII